MCMQLTESHNWLTAADYVNFESNSLFTNFMLEKQPVWYRKWLVARLLGCFYACPSTSKLFIYFLPELKTWLNANTLLDLNCPNHWLFTRVWIWIFHVTTLKKNRKKMAKIAMRNFMIKFYQCIVIYSPQISLLNMKNQNDWYMCNSIYGAKWVRLIEYKHSRWPWLSNQQCAGRMSVVKLIHNY